MIVKRTYISIFSKLGLVDQSKSSTLFFCKTMISCINLQLPIVVMNGVKQGGVLSPVLFAVYTDGLLLRLQESGFGCHMGGHYAGALAYADDVTNINITKYDWFKKNV